MYKREKETRRMLRFTNDVTSQVKQEFLGGMHFQTTNTEAMIFLPSDAGYAEQYSLPA